MVFTMATLIAGVPSLGQWVVGITTMFIGLVLKQHLDDRSKELELNRVKHNIAQSHFTEESNPPISLPDGHLVSNERVVSKLLTIMTSKPYCVLVVGAPPGSGKTSYLAEAMKKFLSEQNGRRLYYFESGLIDLYDRWKIPRHQPLTPYIPQDSVLIFDQVDDRELSSTKKDWIVALATQARNSAKFHVILLVSFPKTMEDILKLNGGKKIMSAFSSDVFIWTRDQLESFTLCLFPALAAEIRGDLVDCVVDGKCAGILHHVAETIRSSTAQRKIWAINSKILTKLKMKLQRSTNETIKIWEEFSHISQFGQFIDDDLFDDDLIDDEDIIDSETDDCSELVKR